MDKLKLVLGLIMAFTIVGILVSIFDGAELGAFGGIIILLVFFASIIGVLFVSDYFENKAKKHNVKKQLEKRELWKEVLAKKPIRANTSETKKNRIPSSFDSNEAANKMIWETVFKTLDISNELEVVIRSFFIADKIDFFKYGDNERVNLALFPNGLDIWRKLNYVLPYFTESLKFQPSPTFEKYFSKDIMKRSLGVVDWFTIAYPDVEVWVKNNMEECGKEINGKKQYYITDGAFNNNAYRYFIDTYKVVCKKKLECSV
ncbi:hypothetical protein [Neotamlana nanhaiensis]|nr:hypothetical protein [Tamlana nanhaiensis]